MVNHDYVVREYEESNRAAGRLLSAPLVALLLLALLVNFKLYDRRLTIDLIAEQIAEQEARIDARRLRLQRDFAIVVSSRVSSRTDVLNGLYSALDTLLPASLDLPLQALKLEFDTELKKAISLRNGELLDDIERVAGVITRFQMELAAFATFQKQTTDAINQLRKESEIRRADNDESLPTPFGTFDIHPRLGLLLVAYASIFLYFAFAAAVARAAQCARQLALAAPDLIEQLHVPFWLSPVIATGSRRIGRIVGNASLHALWALFSLILVYECARWNRVELLWFSSLPAVKELLLLAVLAQVLIAFQFMFPRALPRLCEPINGRVRRLGLRVSRRQVLVGGVSAVVLILASGALWRFIARRGTVEIPDDRMIGNARTGVVHHPRVCASHLPAGKNRVEVRSLLQLDKAHRSKRTWILHVFAEDAESRSVADAIDYLETAIEHAPHDVRLYDALTRLYGRERRYRDIFRMLESGSRLAREASERPNVHVNTRKKLVRVTEMFQVRIAGARGRQARSVA
jgi:hypothetical protein